MSVYFFNKRKMYKLPSRLKSVDFHISQSSHSGCGSANLRNVLSIENEHQSIEAYRAITAPDESDACNEY